MKIELSKKLTALFALFLAVTISVSSQTRNEVVEVYNSAIDLIDTDIKAAIEQMERAIEMAEVLGEEGMEVKEMAEVQLPGLYYDMSLGLARAGETDEAIEGFEKTIEVSDMYDDPESRQRSENILHQLYFSKGNNLQRENENEAALEFFDKALEINPQYARAYLGKGLVFRRLEQTEDFREAMDAAIEYGLQTNDEQIVNTAERTARDYFIVRGARAKSNNEFDRALEYLRSSLNYDSNFPETHYILATIHNEQGNHGEAVKSAERAIDVSDGTAEEKAKYYFELGKAYMELGNNSAACSAFSNAEHGSYAESARYHMDHVLNCQ